MMFRSEIGKCRLRLLLCLQLWLLMAGPVVSEPREYPYNLMHVHPFLTTSFSATRRGGAGETHTGPGLELGLGLSNLVVNRLYLQGAAGLMFFSPPPVDSSFYNRLYAEGSLGRNWRPCEFLTLTPLVGSGVELRLSDLSFGYDVYLLAGGLLDLNYFANRHLFLALQVNWAPASGYPWDLRLGIGLKNHQIVHPAIPAPPSLRLEITPPLFSPDGDGFADLVYLGIRVSGKAPVAYWELEIRDSRDHFVKEFNGTGLPPEEISWDGVGEQGALVSSAMEYPVTVVIEDYLQRKREARGGIVTDILILKEGERFKVQIPDIQFAPEASELIIEGDLERTARNFTILRRLEEIFRKFSGYRLHIEGHANNLSWEDPDLSAVEEPSLLTLSLARAEAVKTALVELGLRPERITTAGLGGIRPLVPFSDLENRWKNRRVEILLIRD